jgi:hypothetical protein
VGSFVGRSEPSGCRVFASVDHLIAAIDEYLDEHNAHPKPLTHVSA